MKCTNCGNEQVTGKFCGKCGDKFEGTSVDNIGVQLDKQLDQTVNEQAATAQAEPQVTPPTQPAEPNVHVENIKKQSKMYSSYFVQQLKKPSLIYNRGEAEFTNGLISIILLGVIISLALYTSMSQMFGSYYSPGFISFFGGALIFTLIAMGIAISSLYLINKFFGPQHSFKAIVSLYGAHLSPFLIAAAASLLLMLLKSFTFGSLLLSLVFMLVVFVLPLYLISFLVTKKPTAIDPLYGFILYIILFSIFFAIIVTVLADSTIGGYLDDLMSFF